MTILANISKYRRGVVRDSVLLTLMQLALYRMGYCWYGDRTALSREPLISPFMVFAGARSSCASVLDTHRSDLDTLVISAT